MDVVTQMHNYVGYLAGYMASTLDHLNQHAPPIVPPSLSQHAAPPNSTPATPPAPQLDAAFAASLDERAHQLYKRLSELRTLAECLPAEMATEEEQLGVLAELNAESEAEQRQLEAVEAEARLWQARLSAALQEAAAAQLTIHTHAQRSAGGKSRGAKQLTTVKRQQTNE